MKKIDVCVLGATGTLGKEYLKLLSRHPFLKLRSVTGYTSVGKKLCEAIGTGEETEDLPAEVADLEVQPTQPKSVDADLVFSPLPNEVARRTEEEFAAADFKVITDAAPHRMDSDVPLIVPEVNPEQLGLLETQRKRGWNGFIAATPNCTTVGITLALKPLEPFGINYVVATTMQAVSGAGYPGVPSLDIIDNVYPYISGEEEKIAAETNKILGRNADPISFAVTATRVPVLNGHTVSLHVGLKEEVTEESVTEEMRAFRGKPQTLGLPTAPEKPLIVFTDKTRPQPRLDREAGSVPGMAVTIGRIRRGILDNCVQFIEVSNNTMRGGAGGAVLTAELMAVEGLI
jgi:aspartate-semialdehyde dehydrogenase